MIKFLYVCRSCKSPKCSCITNGLKCTDMCKLRNCENRLDEEEPEDPADCQEDDYSIDEDQDYD